MWEKLLSVFSALPSLFGKKKDGNSSQLEEKEESHSNSSVQNVIEIGNQVYPVETPTFDVTHIIIHHSDTKDTGAVEWEAIKLFHMKQNGWADIGYHWGIEEVEDGVKILKGRPMTEIGAHTRDGRFNRRSIGVCLVGDFDLVKPTQRHIFIAKCFIRELQTKLRVSSENVIGHREAQAIAHVAVRNRKTCPGRRFNMNDFRHDLLHIKKGDIID